MSYEVSQIFGQKVQERYNPDQLASRKGLVIYRKMMDDEQVKAVMTFRAASITARGFEFKYDDDCDLAPEEQETRIKFFQYNVDALRGSFQDSLNAILRGHVYGYSLTEKVYDVLEFDGRPMNCVTMLLARDPEWFRFFTDRYGVLDRTEQWYGNEHITVDLSKFIHYVRAPEEDRYYGRSDLKAAYRAYYIKDVITNLYATYLERFAGGFAYAELGAESSMTEGNPDYESLKAALMDIRNLAALILPAGVKLTVMQPGSTSEYREALTYFDLAIAKAVLVPNLLGLSHTGQTGAFAQSQTQLEAFFMTTAADATRVEDVLNEQLWRDLGEQNWADGQYPRFYFKPASQEHVKWIVDTWAKLSGSVVQTTEADERHMRKLLDMPARTDEDILTKEVNMQLEQKYAPKPAEQSSPFPFTLNQSFITGPLPGSTAPAHPNRKGDHDAAAVRFHTPGGQDHDQKNHGKPGSGSTDYGAIGRVFGAAYQAQLQSLTDESRSAVREYTTDGYLMINGVLRGDYVDESLVGSYEALEEQIDTLNHLGLTAGRDAVDTMIQEAGGQITLWRGVHVDESNDDEWFDTMQPGAEFEDAAFVSTTLNRDTALRMARSASENAGTDGSTSLLRITMTEAPPSFVGNMDESEIVFNAGLTYRVTNRMRMDDKLEIIDLEVQQ